MKHAELCKNSLDLEYKFESQRALIFLTAGSITLVGFVGAMLVQKRSDLALGLGFAIAMATWYAYGRTKSRMNKILQEIRRLSTDKKSV